MVVREGWQENDPPASSSFLISCACLHVAGHRSHMMIIELEAGEFTALCQDLGIVCIAAKSGDAVTVSLDKRDLEQKAGERGTDTVPQFSVFFDEVSGPALADRDKDRLIRIREADGTVRYYDLRKE